MCRLRCRNIPSDAVASPVVDTLGFLAREPWSVRRVLELVTTPGPTADMYRLDPLVPRVCWNEQVGLTLWLSAWRC